MFDRRTVSLREFVRSQREESQRYQEKRDEEFRELRERAEAQAEETREFNREILLRNEKVYKTVIAEMEEGREQIRANTQAVLRMLDRFSDSGEAAA
ncbi:MAG: hypothetical protein QOF13_2587 [Solirubrobacterales bacterium]|nr:hypothetical protein [Solirubrobacterales bacterium]